MGDMARFGLASLGLCTVLWIGGCPGTLSNPDDFGDGGIEVKDAESIFVDNCTVGCHNDTQMQADLDLLSPGVAGRVVDKDATGIGCTDRTLVVAGDPDSSYLMDKLLNVPGICDNQMPVVGSLTAEEIEVIRQWIIDLGGSFGGTPDGG
ncbi:MAG: hypothetical protein JSV06_04735 [Myxococcales bacterium]|nr:MAG: hypothetical protein JSV06_04735 [Myxococcales bacterium]